MNMAALAAALAQKRAANANSGDLLKKLEDRPSRKDLEDKNILKQGDNISGGLFALRKAQDRDALNNKLSNRPNPSQLAEKGVIKRKFLIESTYQQIFAQI